MRLGDVDLRIRPLTHFARHHEREHARQIGLIRERQQVEHQRRRALRRTRERPRARSERPACVCARCFRPLNAPLNFTHVAEVLAEPRLVGGAEAASRSAAGRRRRNQGGSDLSAAADARSVAVRPLPNNRSKTTRGLISIGSGVVGVCQLSVLM